MGKRLTLVLTLVLAVAMIGAALTYAGARGFRAKLTDEQRAALREKVAELKESGATREEIRAARREMLEGYGIEVPEKGDRRQVRGDGPCADLTEEQRAALQAKVQELKEAGATREEIRATVRTMLTEEYGVELPDRTDQRPRLRRPGLRRLCASLTEEQRAAVRGKVQEMREAGASPEEIRATVRGMLEECGVKLPEEITSPAKLSATTAVQSAGWGQIKSQFK